MHHWIHPTDGTICARAALNRNAFTDALGKMKELSKNAKEYIEKNAEKSFMDLEAEEAKHEAQ